MKYDGESLPQGLVCRAASDEAGPTGDGREKPKSKPAPPEMDPLYIAGDPGTGCAAMDQKWAKAKGMPWTFAYKLYKVEDNVKKDCSREACPCSSNYPCRMGNGCVSSYYC